MYLKIYTVMYIYIYLFWFNYQYQTAIIFDNIFTSNCSTAK